MIAFSKRTQADLMTVRKGDTVCAMGAVTVSFYQTRGGERRFSRTLIADPVLALGRGMKDAPEPGPETKEALAELADAMLGEIERVESDETPILDD